MYLGFPDKEMYHFKVDLPLQELVKVERATSDAVSVSKELLLFYLRKSWRRHLLK